MGVWLRQMSPTLHSHYASLFAKHDVTGIYVHVNSLLTTPSPISELHQSTDSE